MNTKTTDMILYYFRMLFCSIILECYFVSIILEYYFVVLF